MKASLLVVVLSIVGSGSARADCGGHCVAGPFAPNPSWCNAVSSYPKSIQEGVCRDTTGCQWQSGQEIGQCAARSFAPNPSWCNIVNTYPQNIQRSVCQDTAGCEWLLRCE
jgi:hypothetical protein